MRTEFCTLGTENYMISLENVTFSYPKANEAIIRAVSADFRTGECVAVTGHNGCGKTTLIQLICGVLRPASGHILINGNDTSALSLFEIGQQIGCVFQDPARQLFCETVEEEIRFGLEAMGLPETEIRSRTEKYLAAFRLEHRRNAFPGLLSQGEKQRTILAAVLSMGTEFVVLDEPTSGLDMEGRKELGTLLRGLTANGHGVIFVSHERAFIDTYATREWVIR